ncbi:hypothetical protein ACFQZE_15585 [Paenibacillus sp. GCM10027627]|uniref:hypothetical protein n=1 Tax=unclassified Paenibacillus TaxID=185978 RepID=UPI003631F879
MYQFIKELEEMKCPPLIVKEKELSEDSSIRKKFVLDESDIRPEFSKEVLEQGYVVFPVYRDTRILPLQYGAKYCDYRVVNYGGACEIIQEYGKMEINPQDTRYMKPSSENPKPRSFHFYYDRKEGRYKQEPNEERWQLKINELKKIKSSEHINELVWMFYDFYQGIWIDSVQCQSRFNLNQKPTHLDYLDYLYFIDCQIENVKAYTLLLHIFGELSEEEYQMTVKMIESLELHIERARKYLHSKKLEDRFDPKDDAVHGKTIEKLQTHIKVLLKPGYFVDPLRELMFPNIGELYDRLQLSRVYNNFETLREKKENIIIKAKKALQLKGKTTINVITDFLVYFVN